MQLRLKLAYTGIALIFVMVPGIVSMQGCASPATSTTVYADGGRARIGVSQNDKAAPYVRSASIDESSQPELSSVGYDAAVESGSEEAIEAYGLYRDGVYSAVAQGKCGDVWVTVTIADGRIADIAVDDGAESPAMAQKARETVVPQILDAQSVEGIDAASGATVTSDAIVAAVADALERASW